MGFVKPVNMDEIVLPRKLGLKNFQNYYFLYKNILDTCLLWGNSHKKIFENISRLMRFSVFWKNLEYKIAILSSPKKFWKYGAF